ncbi:hypothetical protein DL96DRAFT_1277471 [Flagelloscypha sp. PMI_526]|nr:hypothetical protein DL96DRAFT_1277471 [Flagelloscypha sp. PMI_526]
MHQSTPSTTKQPENLHLDIFSEIIAWLPKEDLPVWALVNKALLPCVRRALYYFLKVDIVGICRLMKNSSQFLSITKHLRITYQGRTRTPDLVIGFFSTLVEHGQLCSFALIDQEKYSQDSVDDLIYSTFSGLFTSLHSLKRIEVLNVSRPRDSIVPSYLSFFHQVLSHPELCCVEFQTCSDANYFLYNGLIFSPRTSLVVDIQAGSQGIVGWKELLTYLDLTQLRHLSLRWIFRPAHPIQRFLREQFQETVHLPHLTHLYFEVRDVPFEGLLSQFRDIQHLTIVFACAKSDPYANTLFALSKLNRDALRSIRVYIPMPWSHISERFWKPFLWLSNGLRIFVL